MIGWLTSRGAGAILGRLFDLYERRARANSDLERQKIDAEIRALEIERDTIAATRPPGSLTARVAAVLMLLAGLGPALHYGAVCLDSAFPGLFPGWTVHALPPPMDEWQGWIILSLFGVTALLRRGR